MRGFFVGGTAFSLLMIMKLLFYAALAGLIACNNSARPVHDRADSLAPDGTLQQDTPQVEKDTAAVQRPARPPQGIYQTSLPCSNCPALLHTIAFFPDNTFRLEEKKQAGKEAPSATTGTYTVSGQRVALYRDQLLLSQYHWDGKQLAFIRGTQQHPLSPAPFAGDNEVWKKKKDQGTRFFGVGNEPFWNVEIRRGNDIAFQLADWGKPLLFGPGQPLRSADSILYNVANDSGRLQLVVYDRFCSDGMSDFVYTSEVKVVYNGRSFSGCGLWYQ